MDDYALVLNAGSSSLKFCVFPTRRQQELAAGCPGPDRRHRHVARAYPSRMTAGAKLADETLDASVQRRDGRAGGARGAGCEPGAAARRCSASGIGWYTVARGTPARSIVTPEVLEDLRTSSRWRRSISLTTSPRSRPSPNGSRRAAGRLLRHQLSSRHARGRRARAAPARPARRGRAALRLPRPLLRVHRLRPAAGGARDRRRPGDRRPPGQRREPVRAPEDGRSVDTTLGFTALDGLCMGTRPGVGRSGSDPPSVPDARAVGQGSGKDPLQEVGTARHFRDQQRHARSAGQPRARRAPGGRLLRLSRRQSRSERSRRCWAAWTHWSSRRESARHSAEIRRRICEASAWLGVDAGSRRPTQQHGPGITTSGSRVSAWVVPTNEELMIARHTGALLGISATPPAGGHSRSVT